MSGFSELLQCTDEERRKILEVHNVTEEEFAANVENIREWIMKNENLPNEASWPTRRLELSLVNSKMSTEKAKTVIDKYLNYKLLYDDIFTRSFSIEHYKTIKGFTQQAIIPKLLPNLCRLLITKMTDVQGDAVDAFDYFANIFMMVELRMMHDFYLANELILDMELYQVKTLFKYTPSVNQKLLNIMTALSVRLSNIHIVNVPSMWDKIFFMLKSLLPSKIFDKIIIHQNVESLQKYIPKEYLPSDYGGTQKSAAENYGIWNELMEANQATLTELLNIKAKKVMLEESAPSNELGMGCEGSFKKLSVD